MAEENAIKREDLIGRTGSVTRQIEIIDAKEYNTNGIKSVNVRVSDNFGNEYWTTLEDDDISLD